MARKKAAKKAPAGAEIEEYYPLVKGCVYRYDFHSPDWPYNNVMTIRAKNVKSVGAKTTAEWEEMFPDPNEPESRPYAHRWKVERSAKGVREWRPHIKWENWTIRTPLRKGATWERKDGTKFTIASLEGKVKVPAGVYENCLHVTYGKGDLGSGEIFYAKGIGMVRSKQRGEWVPYDYDHDYELASVGQAALGEAPRAVKALSWPRMRAAKGTGVNPRG